MACEHAVAQGVAQVSAGEGRASPPLERRWPQSAVGGALPVGARDPRTGYGDEAGGQLHPLRSTRSGATAPPRRFGSESGTPGLHHQPGSIPRSDSGTTRRSSPLNGSVLVVRPRPPALPANRSRRQRHRRSCPGHHEGMSSGRLHLSLSRCERGQRRMMETTRSDDDLRLRPACQLEVMVEWEPCGR